jgi:hypothetical protein
MDSDSRLNANTLAIGDISIDTHESSPQAAIPGLLNDIVATHILSTEYFDDPAELARLRVVSRAMRAAVTATGLAFEEMDLVAAMKYGCFSAMKRLQRRGLLMHQEFLCPTAARAGLLQELKLLRENNSPWDEGTCCAAAAGGHEPGADAMEIDDGAGEASGNAKRKFKERKGARSGKQRRGGDQRQRYQN